MGRETEGTVGFATLKVCTLMFKINGGGGNVYFSGDFCRPPSQLILTPGY